MRKNIELNASELTYIIKESVGQILEGIFSKKQNFPEKPQKASDVIRANGWTGKTVDKAPNMVVIRCYPDAPMWKVLPFDDLVEDLNIYYQHKGVPCKATGLDEYNGQRGGFIVVKRGYKS